MVNFPAGFTGNALRRFRLQDEGGCAELIGQDFDPLYVELWTEGGEKTRRTKAASKTRYTCPDCQTNAWAKPGVHLICGECEVRMQSEEEV